MFAFAAAAAAVFTGCEKNHEEGFIGDGKAVELEVRLPDMQTKAEGLENENKVRILGAIDLTEYMLDILYKRRSDSYRLLDSIFDYMRGIKRGEEDG